MRHVVHSSLAGAFTSISRSGAYVYDYIYIQPQRRIYIYIQPQRCIYISFEIGRRLLGVVQRSTSYALLMRHVTANWLGL